MRLAEFFVLLKQVIRSDGFSEALLLHVICSKCTSVFGTYSTEELEEEGSFWEKFALSFNYVNTCLYTTKSHANNCLKKKGGFD